MEILRSADMSERDKYKKLYRHLLDSDEIVANCFDDWRRSTIRLKVVMLHRHSLLTAENLRHLSDETKSLLASIDQLSERQ
ncbi:MAG: hypothetical protein ACLPX5_12680 [Dissulfurispiraceae bacterium]